MDFSQSSGYVFDIEMSLFYLKWENLAEAFLQRKKLYITVCTVRLCQAPTIARLTHSPQS